MTREEAVKDLDSMRDWFNSTVANDEHYWSPAIGIAIRSLEAWDKVFHEANERYITFIPSNFEEGETYEGAFHDGMGYVMDVIDKHLKEVEE